jgi:hypothetical protein
MTGEIVMNSVEVVEDAMLPGAEKALEDHLVVLIEQVTESPGAFLARQDPAGSRPDSMVSIVNISVDH